MKLSSSCRKELEEAEGKVEILLKQNGKLQADVAIVDIERASISDVHRLSSEFPGVGIVCTHRLADEEMWTEALSAGAADICPSNDTRSIITAAKRSAGMMHSAAA